MEDPSRTSFLIVEDDLDTLHIQHPRSGVEYIMDSSSTTFYLMRNHRDLGDEDRENTAASVDSDAETVPDDEVERYIVVTYEEELTTDEVVECLRRKRWDNKFKVKFESRRGSQVDDKS